MVCKKTIVLAVLSSTAYADKPLRGLNGLGDFGGGGDDANVNDGPIDGESPCGQLVGCYLWDKTAKVELELTGNDMYCPSDSTRGWSVRCDTAYSVDDGSGNMVNAVVDEIKFFYDDIVNDEYGEPRWMNGDADSDDGGPRWINDVEYLAKPGDKEFNIEGRQWAKSCFKESYTLVDNCPTKSPTDAPTVGPTIAPTDAPTTDAPTAGPTVAPDPCVVEPFELKEIPGAFEIEVTFRFDDITGNGHWQRVFDFGNGAGKDNIWMGQYQNRPDMCFGVYQNGKNHYIIQRGAIIQGETATWNVGVTETGEWWMAKNGVRLVERQGEVLNPNVIRKNKYVAMSNWVAGGGHHMKGAVTGINIMNAGEKSNEELLNTPVRIHGAFSFSAIAQFDTVTKSSWQRVFDFGNGKARDNIWFGQDGTSKDIVLGVYIGSDGANRLTAKNVIEEGEQATWSGGVDCSGRMWIKKNCVLVAEGESRVPENMNRSSNLVGISNWPGSSGKLDGSVFGLKFDVPSCAAGMPTGSPTPIPNNDLNETPKITSCSRLNWWINYSPVVPKGVLIQAKSPKDGSIIEYTSAGTNRVSANMHVKAVWDYFVSFYRQGFEMRFVAADGTPGPWSPCNTNTPIGIDIDNSGAVERITGEFEIDITGDGNMNILHEWFAPSEGILINMMPFIKDGQVTGQNLFGDMGRTYADGFVKLGLLDKDGDKIISGTELDGLAIWTDVNSNARLDDGELSSLEAHGIVGLRTDDDANYASSAVLSNGMEMYMEDLWFAR